MRKIAINRVILKTLGLKNRITFMKDKWRYIRPEDVPKYRARGYVVERGELTMYCQKRNDKAKNIDIGS